MKQRKTTHENPTSGDESFSKAYKLNNTNVPNAKLPETEFEVMSAIWNNEPPVTTTLLMKQLGNKKGWKLQTLVTLLNRLMERGFLKSEKSGKERTYYPCIKKEDYIRYETSLFIERYHNNSLLQLVNAFSGNNKLSKEDMEELSLWLKNQEE